MINRSIHMIFESSGMPVPSEEELRFEAKEIVQRSGWGIPLILALKRIANPYWREAITRVLLNKWIRMVAEKDERVFYYDGDGNGIYCWLDAESDMNRIIKGCTAEQVLLEQGVAMPVPQPVTQPVKKERTLTPNITLNINIEKNYAPITNFEQSNVTYHQ